VYDNSVNLEDSITEYLRWKRAIRVKYQNKRDYHSRKGLNEIERIAIDIRISVNYLSLWTGNLGEVEVQIFVCSFSKLAFERQFCRASTRHIVPVRVLCTSCFRKLESKTMRFEPLVHHCDLMALDVFRVSRVQSCLFFDCRLCQIPFFRRVSNRYNMAERCDLNCLELL
jgi:hypothetical protein